MTDIEKLQLKKAAMEAAMAERQKASADKKFNKMKFPPHGKAFMDMYKQICDELESRK
jgi:hypothetical protein